MYLVYSREWNHCMCTVSKWIRRVGSVCSHRREVFNYVSECPSISFLCNVPILQFMIIERKIPRFKPFERDLISQIYIMRFVLLGLRPKWVSVRTTSLFKIFYHFFPLLSHSHSHNAVLLILILCLRCSLFLLSYSINPILI